MRRAEALETTRIHSVAGLTSGRASLVTTRPFRAPHHTISAVGVIGAGRLPMPGEVSPANHGILLLDEVPEFKRHVLEVLRQALEDGIVAIARILLAATFPTHLTLLEAVYACSEGRRNPKRGCTGTPHLLPDLLPVSLPRPYALRYAVR
jgi:magnesium chelatase family protein